MPVSSSVILIPASYERGSTSRMTLRPLEVVVEATGPAITSSDPGGPPRQLRVIWVKMRCSTLFHFEVPGGRWRVPPPCGCGRRVAVAEELQLALPEPVAAAVGPAAVAGREESGRPGAPLAPHLVPP